MGPHFWIATAIFIIAYAVIVSEKVHKTIVAICGAALMLVLKILEQHEAFHLEEFGVEMECIVRHGEPHEVIPELARERNFEEMIGFLKTDGIREQLHDEAKKIVFEGKSFARGKGVSVETVVEEGSPSEKVIETAKARGIDLIVMGSHGWRGVNKALLGSTTERVIAYSAAPVLVAR